MERRLNKMIKGEVVGEGAYGKVYLAKDSVISSLSSTDSPKYVIKRNIVEREVDWAANLREPDILLRLKGHPNIVKLEKVIYGKPFESGRLSPTKENYKDDKLHFVMEMGDLDLGDLIQGTKTDTSPDYEITFEDIKPIMVDTLLGLEYMHHNHIIHRDIKPGNILIFMNNIEHVHDTLTSIKPFSRLTAKICDFGLSKFYTLQEPQTPRMVTSWYRAPEIAMGAINYDYKVDVWALGCVIYEMVVGESLIVSRDDNKMILEQILTSLPERLPSKENQRLKELFKVKLPRGRKKAFIKVLFPENTRTIFREKTGSPESFVELLKGMLEFYPDNRFNVSQILDHPFFDDYKDYITSIRDKWMDKIHYSGFKENEKRITITDCPERKWGICTAFYFYNKNNEERLEWYKPRILFQAMNLFDRYLNYTNDPENDILEKYEDSSFSQREETEMRFVACIYISIKYFATLITPPPYAVMYEQLFQKENSQEFVRIFEKEFLEKVLKYKIYLPTVFEYADLIGEKLSSLDIMNLIMAYGNCGSKTNMKIDDFYHELRRSTPL